MKNEVVNSISSRYSVKFVQEPGPNEQELDMILQSAMSAPDHGKLRPWRFKLIRGSAKNKLADLSIQAIKNNNMPFSSEKEAKTREWLDKAPLVIAIACYIDHSNTKIRHEERLLATGAAVSNILNTSHALGYKAYWSTGLGTYLEEVATELGFDPLEYTFMGFLSIGTPSKPFEAPVRPKYQDFVSEFT